MKRFGDNGQRGTLEASDFAGMPIIIPQTTPNKQAPVGFYDRVTITCSVRGNESERPMPQLMAQLLNVILSV